MGLRQSAVEDMVNGLRSPDAAFWRRRRVLITGHTGFKGAWLTTWLAELGSEVHGLALEPPTTPNLFSLADIGAALASDTRADLRDMDAVASCLHRCRPQIVLHLAAQSLVRLSYAEPLATFATNVMGTAHVLEAVRRTPGVAAAVIVTTDKCYENREWDYRYRENDPLGGHDPYSASKAAAEIATACWRASFADPGQARIASARAGNVIGAGDWADERLLPDCFRAFAQSRPVSLRNPRAVRPWQHVLEPLSGYLLLAESLCGDSGAAFARSWNFGPDPASDASVGEVARMAAALWGGAASVLSHEDQGQPHEAGVLRLDSTLARTRLGWAPRWPLATALAATVIGHRGHADGRALAALVRGQIADYCAAGASEAHE